ncbi:MAG: hypothetical protein ABIQ39_02865 [Ilumatobacteraceae bacterium]
MTHTRTILLAALTLTVLGGCGSDTKASTSPTTAPTSPTAAPTSTAASAPVGLSGQAVQLGGDPCALLTVPEMEAVLGSGVEQGGFGTDLPGRCTFSRGGDIGSGVVQITLQDPPTCNVVMKALASGSLEGTNATRIDVGDGGLFIKDSYAVFTIHGGCVAIGGSKHGINLGQEKLVSLATAAAGRVA